MFKNKAKRNRCLYKVVSLLINGTPTYCFQFQGPGMWSAQRTLHHQVSVIALPTVMNCLRISTTWRRTLVINNKWIIKIVFSTLTLCFVITMKTSLINSAPFVLWSHPVYQSRPPWQLFNKLSDSNSDLNYKPPNTNIATKTLINLMLVPESPRELVTSRRDQW